jgi:hypothetical protein
MPSVPNGYVYFVEAEGVGRIKIGWTENLPERLKTLQLYSPVPLRLLGACWVTSDMEKSLHKTFADRRVVGEWFEPDSDLMELIRKHAARPLGRWVLHTEGDAVSWVAPKYNVGCRLCLAIIPAGTKGYRYERPDGNFFDACATCSLAEDGEPRRVFDLSSRS